MDKVYGTIGLIVGGAFLVAVGSEVASTEISDEPTLKEAVENLEKATDEYMESVERCERYDC